MNNGQIVLWLSIILLLSFLVGTSLFLLYVIRLSRKYRAYKADLQSKGEYQDWVSQHKGLVTFERIFGYLNLVFLGAALLLGYAERHDISSNMFVTISAILVYLFYPYLLVSLFVISQLYKKVPSN